MDYLFDTHALITLLFGENGCDIVQNLMKEIENRESKGLISVITLTELKYLFTNRFGGEEADIRIHPILTSYLTIIPVSLSIAISAGRIKKSGISLADAIIAATALEMDCEVVSGDRHFSRMGVRVQSY